MRDLAFHKFIFFALLSSLLSCGQTEFGTIPNVDVFGQKYTYGTKVDVLWVVDNSESMGLYQQHVADQFSAFIDVLNSKGMDFNLAVTTMDNGRGGERGNFVGSPRVLSNGTPNLKSLFENTIQVGENGSDLERGIGAMMNALSTEKLTTVNTGFLRKDALLAIIFISNEDDHSSPSPEEASEFLDALKPNTETDEPSWIVNYIGITDPEGFCKTTGQYAEPGDHFLELVELSGGVSEDICEPELGTALKNIRKRVLSRLTEFRLKDIPIVSTIKVYMNGKKVAKSTENGWIYIKDTRVIRFSGNSIPGANDKIEVEYDIER